MAKAKRKRRWLMWLSLAGLALTLAAGLVSEFGAVSWRENAAGTPSRFLLYRSSVLVVYRKGPDDIDRLGRELFNAGWSFVKPPRELFSRAWAPGLSVRTPVVGHEIWHVQLPLWIPALACLMGVWWGRRGGWTGENVCRACGYDLRGGVGVRCPECGSVIGESAPELERRAT